jgi:4-carboxymuconolactone decarboxylase
MKERKVKMPQSKNPISRVGAASDESGDEILVDMFARIRARRGYVLNIHQVVGHSPKMLRAQATYAHAMREESVLPRDLQELLILRVAQVNDSDYEQSVHRPIALACGIPLAKIEALPNWRSSAAYNAKERAALAFVDQAADSGEVDDDVFAAAGEVFSRQEIVELAVLVSWYVGNSRFVRMLRIAPESHSK